VTATFGLYNVIAQSSLKQGDLINLRIPACGGEQTPENPTRIVNERLRWAGSTAIYIGGGSTEFGSGTMAAFGLEDRCNETGMSIPGAETIIIDPLTGKKAIDGDEGIIYTNCPWQMKEYLNNKKATEEFFNYTDDSGKVFGTNGDIGKVVREYNGKPVYAMQGRIKDFIVRTPDKKRYTLGVKFTNGKIDPVDFKKGEMLFKLRDKILNIPGVLEAEALLLPNNDRDITGLPVVNVVIEPQQDPVAILKSFYSMYKPDDEFIPFGVFFRSGFARSLASDKRDNAALVRDRSVYYSINSEGTVFGAEFPKGEEPIVKVVTNTSVIQRFAPPVPRAVRLVE
ncbi:MAG: long-chain fatty acid--CoA ligase, partial [Defluviitaleaceae bacterium]|nr:long-chain fatty acid--CoA ligase [Defluviitaleaceae bacterium]